MVNNTNGRIFKCNFFSHLFFLSDELISIIIQCETWIQKQTLHISSNMQTGKQLEEKKTPQDEASNGLVFMCVFKLNRVSSNEGLWNYKMTEFSGPFFRLWSTRWTLFLCFSLFFYSNRKKTEQHWRSILLFIHAHLVFFFIKENHFWTLNTDDLCTQNLIRHMKEKQQLFTNDGCLCLDCDFMGFLLLVKMAQKYIINGYE